MAVGPGAPKAFAVSHLPMLGADIRTFWHPTAEVRAV
jgi:hypothetical protein